MTELTILPSYAEHRCIVRLRVPLASAPGVAEKLQLPTGPLICSESEPVGLWIGPDQWLLVSERQSAAQIIAACHQRLGDILHIASDETDAFVCIAIEGRGGRSLLAMGAGVDFGQTAFGHFRCLRTRMAGLAVIIRALPNQFFELLVDRSAHEYFLAFLHRNARDPLLRRDQ
jgi:heterotetrameric sarcosine oxidase gamma subunit